MATILIVDDSPTEQKELAQIVSKNGHHVILANDGDSAVTITNSEGPDLILMDIVMPTLNGFQATRQISKANATAHIPIILISSKDQETDRQWGLRQGARHYLVKPVKEQTLIDAINQLLAL